MTRALFKKQMMELFSFFWQDKKKNKIRTGRSLAMGILMYVVLFGVLAAMFYMLADALCEPLVKAGLGWLYFSLMGLIGVALGAFGSIFNTYASLYLAKDNSFLLAMPIPASGILTVRLMGVYFMGLMYQLLVMLPVLVKYFMIAKPGVFTVLCSVLVTLVLSVFVLTLSAVLGWVVALISTKTKHKSIVTVVLSLLFIAGYYYAYARAAGALQEMLVNPGITAELIRGKLFPVYHMGMAAEGNPGSLAILAAMFFALFGIVYLILEKSYMKIITTNKGEAKVKYREQRAKKRSVSGALLGKEFRRFLGSPNYMLNCGLGTVMMLIAAIALLIKADTVMRMMTAVFGDSEERIALIAAAAVCVCTSMNDITAPSVSLEGKNIWLLQSFPVSAGQVLMAKMKLHLILTLIPMAVLAVCVEVVLKPSLLFAVLIPAAGGLFVWFMALFGLFLNLKMPNLTWTNEIVPIKQSMGVMVALFGGWALVTGLGVLCYLTRKIVDPEIFLIGAMVLVLAACLILLQWIRSRGAQIFENL